MNNFAETIIKISEEIDKEKKRIVINPKIYNLYKDELDQISKECFAIIIQSDLVPEDNIFIINSEKEIQDKFFKPSLILESQKELFSFLTGF